MSDASEPTPVLDRAWAATRPAGLSPEAVDRIWVEVERACKRPAILTMGPSPRSGQLVAAGLLVGATGIAHAHLLFTALALGAMAGLADRRRTWWWFLGPAAVVGLPLAWAISPYGVADGTLPTSDSATPAIATRRFTPRPRSVQRRPARAAPSCPPSSSR